MKNTKVTLKEKKRIRNQLVERLWDFYDQERKEFGGEDAEWLGAISTEIKPSRKTFQVNNNHNQQRRQKETAMEIKITFKNDNKAFGTSYTIYADGEPIGRIQKVTNAKGVRKGSPQWDIVTRNSLIINTATVLLSLKEAKKMATNYFSKVLRSIPATTTKKETTMKTLYTRTDNLQIIITKNTKDSWWTVWDAETGTRIDISSTDQGAQAGARKLLKLTAPEYASRVKENKNLIGNSKTLNSTTSSKGDTMKKVTDKKATRIKKAEKAAKAAPKNVTITLKRKGKKVVGEVTKGRPSKFTGKTIKATRKDNPRRKGTLGFRSYAIILQSRGRKISYKQFIIKGGRAKDLAWDIDKGYATVK